MNSLVKTISTRLDNLGRRLIKALANGPADVRESIQAAPHGIDSNPVKDMVAIYAQTEERGKAYVVGYLNKDLSASVGELRLFSTSESGQLAAWMWLKNNGNIEILGSDDNLIKYAQTAATIKEIQDDIKALKQAFTTWVPVAYDGGAALKAATGSWFSQPLTEDISGAKFDEVKTK